MDSEFIAANYVHLGQYLGALQRVATSEELLHTGQHVQMYVTNLKLPQAVAQLRPLAEKTRRIDAETKAMAGAPMQQAIQLKNGLGAEERTAVLHWVDSIRSAVFAECAQRHFTIHKKSEPADHLETIANNANDGLFKILCEETINGLRNGSYRSAIVMVWAAAIEQVRHYILADAQRLKDFNTALTTPTTKGKVLFDPVSTYDDFTELNDHTLIEAAKPPVLVKDVWEVFSNNRTRRNHFGHPSLVAARESTANHLVDDLTANVLAKLPMP